MELPASRRPGSGSSGLHENRRSRGLSGRSPSTARKPRRGCTRCNTMDVLLRYGPVLSSSVVPPHDGDLPCSLDHRGPISTRQPFSRAQDQRPKGPLESALAGLLTSACEWLPSPWATALHPRRAPSFLLPASQHAAMQRGPVVSACAAASMASPRLDGQLGLSVSASASAWLE